MTAGDPGASSSGHLSPAAVWPCVCEELDTRHFTGSLQPYLELLPPLPVLLPPLPPHRVQHTQRLRPRLSLALVPSASAEMPHRCPPGRLGRPLTRP